MFKDKRILAVDDSVAIRNYLRAILKRQGASVDVAGTGEQGLEQCAGEGSYDLILLDLILPDMNGLDVLQKIRQEDEETAIVILTGVGGAKSAISAVRRGADAYVEKQDIAAGSDLAEFYYILEQALEHRAGLVAQKQLEKVKADFYSMVTHDLRGPAGNISTSSEMLIDGLVGPLTPEQMNLMVIIQGSAEKMHRLISDYLDFAKIDAGYLRLEMDEVELRDIVETSAQLVRLQAQSKSLELVLDLPPDPVRAYADPDRFPQVLDNLLSNAIKYTPDEGRITVQLYVEDGQAVIRISDTGTGIRPNQLSALFTKYHRVPGEATRGIRGTGLGLLIIKEIVDAHGGSVLAESEGVGQGSTFTVKIPLEPVTTDQPQEATA